MKRKINNAYYALRFAVLKRDKFTCQYCGQYAPNVRLEVDHIITIEDGGTDHMDNLKTSCSACNRGRSGLRIQVTRSNHIAGLKPYKSLTNPAPRQEEVVQLLKFSFGGLTSRQIAEKLNIDLAYAHVLMNRLLKRGKVKAALPLSKIRIWLSS